MCIRDSFEGRRATSGEKGDDKLRDATLFTLQLHSLIIPAAKGVDQPSIAAPAVAAHFPDGFDAGEVMFQKKKGQA